MDRTRTIKKGVTASNLEELVRIGRHKLGYKLKQDLYLVLEEDGTEIDEEDYFQTIPENTTLMLLFTDDRWSPFATIDQTDSAAASRNRLVEILCRLEKDPGTIALLDGADLELLAQMDTKETMTRFPRFSTPFLCQLQEAADRHLLEKNEIRDTLGLLNIYHRSQCGSSKQSLEQTQVQQDLMPPVPPQHGRRNVESSPRKRHKVEDDHDKDTVG
jgi:DNA fragmentation factor alpha subunit